MCALSAGEAHWIILPLMAIGDQATGPLISAAQLAAPINGSMTVCFTPVSRRQGAFQAFAGRRWTNSYFDPRSCLTTSSTPHTNKKNGAGVPIVPMPFPNSAARLLQCAQGVNSTTTKKSITSDVISRVFDDRAQDRRIHMTIFPDDQGSLA